FAGIFLRELGDLLRGTLLIVVEDDCASIRRQCDRTDFWRDPLQAMLLERHVTSDVGTDRSGSVGEGGAAESGMKLFSDGRASGLGAALQHQRLKPGLGEIEGGDEAVVTATDDDDIASLSQ